VSFAGNLKTVSFGDVLQLISTGRRTGALVLKRPHRGKTIYFRTGDIIAAASDPPTDEERLGQLLLRKGLINVENLEKALKRQKSTGRRLGQILVELGHLSKEDIAAALRLQVEEVVYGVFGWNDGDFHFNEGEKPDASQILVELNTLSVMMEGARRFDEYSGIASTLPAEETVLRFVPSPHLKDPEIVLSAEDVDVLSAINGQRSVAEIVATSSYGEYAASKSLHKLLTSHLVESSPEVADAVKQRADEDELIVFIFKLHAHALVTIHATLSEFLGGAGDRLYFKLPAASYDDPWELAAPLIDSESASSFGLFREHIARVPGPVRLHRAVSTAQALVREGMRTLRDTLGEKVMMTVADTTKRELAVLLAQKRPLTDKFDVHNEFFAALKGR
jgi:hypothetical protein